MSEDAGGEYKLVSSLSRVSALLESGYQRVRAGNLDHGQGVRRMEMGSWRCCSYW